MGGLGSGNRYHWRRGSKKTVIEACLSIEASRWSREGILKAGVCETGSWRWTYHNGGGFSVAYDVWTQVMTQPMLRLCYSWTWRESGKLESVVLHVPLTTTRPRFGGARWWFRCPLSISGRPCKRRVGKLYLPPHAHYFGCRHCHDLTYTSCQESRKNDSLSRFIARTMGLDFATAKRTLNKIGKRRCKTGYTSTAP